MIVILVSCQGWHRRSLTYKMMSNVLQNSIFLMLTLGLADLDLHISCPKIPFVSLALELSVFCQLNIFSNLCLCITYPINPRVALSECYYRAKLHAMAGGDAHDRDLMVAGMPPVIILRTILNFYTETVSMHACKIYWMRQTHITSSNKAIVDIRLLPRCAITRLTLYTSLTYVSLTLN